MVAKIATGEIAETTDDGKNKAAVELGRKGGQARAKKLSKKRHAEIARQAALNIPVDRDIRNSRI